MSQIRTIGEAVAAHIETALTGTSAVFEPVDQFAATATRTATVHWSNGQAGTPDGDISLGGDTDIYTDNFTIRLFRLDGDFSALLADLQTLSLSLNYEWSGVADLDYRRVMSRSVLRERQDDGSMSPVRGVELVLQVCYTES